MGAGKAEGALRGVEMGCRQVVFHESVLWRLSGMDFSGVKVTNFESAIFKNATATKVIDI